MTDNASDNPFAPGNATPLEPHMLSGLQWAYEQVNALYHSDQMMDCAGEAMVASLNHLQKAITYLAARVEPVAARQVTPQDIIIDEMRQITATMSDLPMSMRAPEPYDAIEYLLHTMEEAAHHDKPADHGYGDKRRALIAAIKTLRAERDTAVKQLAERASAEKDAALIDWLFAHVEDLQHFPEKDWGCHPSHQFLVRWWRGDESEQRESWGETALDAIRAAMNAEPDRE